MESITQGNMILLITVVAFLQAINAAEWEYSGEHGPEYWKDINENCAGKSQSPINIHTGDVKFAAMPNFQFTGYNQLSKMWIQNNGHTVQINLNDTTACTIHGGGLNGEKYNLAQLHFHWGDDMHIGSEHTVDDHSYEAEMHFVHYDASLALGDAVGHKPDGLAVLGVMIKVGQYDHPAFNHIINHFNKVMYKGQQANINEFALDALLPEDRRSFFRYQGSLTTPGCFESVTWTVFTQHITISKQQMDAFRSLQAHTASDSEHESILNNFRPVQPLNGRDVYISVWDMTAGSSTPSSQITIISFALASVAAFLRLKL